jgi:hypothetical protein
LKPKHHPDPSLAYPLGLVRWSGQLVADLGWLGFFRASNPAPTGLFPYIFGKTQLR